MWGQGKIMKVDIIEHNIKTQKYRVGWLGFNGIWSSRTQVISLLSQVVPKAGQITPELS